ncbi:MAG: hypothetical protein GY856_04280 [bacterium]|nr:hypothetical protein [bacterium]
MPEPLRSIIALQTAQQNLAEAEARIQGIPDWMRELHEEHQRRKGEIGAVEATRDEAELQRRTAESELAEAQEKSKQYQQQLSRVATQREYGALLKEIDTIKERINAHEQQALEALERSEESQKRLQELGEEFRDLDQRYQTELAKWEQEKPAIAGSIDELTREVRELRKQLPRGILPLFDRIYERHGGHALGRIEQTKALGTNTAWHCAACSYNVRPQILIEIRNSGSLIQCDSCKRILYWEDGE